MKKLNMKLIVSAFLATAMIAGSAVSASAIDYGGTKRGNEDDLGNVSVNDNTGGLVSVPQTTTPTDSDVGGANDENAANTATAAIVEAAIAGDGEVYMEEADDGTVTVTKDAVLAANGEDVTFEVTLESGTTYSVTISDVTEARDIDLAMDIVTGSAAEQEYDVPAGSIVIAPNMHGSFGMTLTITIPANGISRGAKLFYIDDEGNVKEADDAQIVFNDDGTVSISITHASAYVITTEDLLEDEDDDDDADILSDDDDDDDDAVIENDDDDDDVAVQPAKTNDTPIVISNEPTDADGNPGTGVSLALGALAASAAAVVVAKKRK